MTRKRYLATGFVTTPWSPALFSEWFGGPFRDPVHCFPCAPELHLSLQSKGFECNMASQNGREDFPRIWRNA
jgi:hypothetical protein